MKDSEIEKIALIIKTIAHPVRLKILCILLGGEATVSEIHENFSSSYANVSKHLHKLHDQGIVSKSREGNYAYYFISNIYIGLIKILEKNYCPSVGSQDKI